MSGITDAVSDVKGFGGLRDLKKYGDISLQDILVALIEGNKDMELKTNIYSPHDLATLKVVARAERKRDYERASKTLEKWIHWFIRFMVSKDGAGRTGILKAVSSLMDRETIKMSISDKLITNTAK